MKNKIWMFLFLFGTINTSYAAISFPTEEATYNYLGLLSLSSSLRPEVVYDMKCDLINYFTKPVIIRFENHGTDKWGGVWIDDRIIWSQQQLLDKSSETINFSEFSIKSPDATLAFVILQADETEYDTGRITVSCVANYSTGIHSSFFK